MNSVKFISIFLFLFSCSEKIHNKVVERHEDGSRKTVLKILSKARNYAVILNRTSFDLNGRPRFIQNRNKSNQLNGIQLDSIYYPFKRKFIQLKTIYQNDSKVVETSELGTANFQKAYKYGFGKPHDGIHLEYELVERDGSDYKRLIYVTPYKDAKKHGIQIKFAHCSTHGRCNDRYMKRYYWINDEMIANSKDFFSRFDNGQ